MQRYIRLAVCITSLAISACDTFSSDSPPYDGGGLSYAAEDEIAAVRQRASEISSAYSNTLGGVLEVHLKTRPSWTTRGQIFVTVSSILSNFHRIDEASRFERELLDIVRYGRAGFFELDGRLQMFLAEYPVESIKFANEWNGDPFSFSVQSRSNSYPEGLHQFRRAVEVIRTIYDNRFVSQKKLRIERSDLENLKGKIIFKIIPEGCDNQLVDLKKRSKKAPQYCRDSLYLQWLFNEATILSAWEAYTRVGEVEETRQSIEESIRMLEELGTTSDIVYRIIVGEFDNLNKTVATFKNVPFKQFKLEISDEDETNACGLDIEPFNMRTCREKGRIFVSREILDVALSSCASVLPQIRILNNYRDEIEVPRDMPTSPDNELWELRQRQLDFGTYVPDLQPPRSDGGFTQIPFVFRQQTGPLEEPQGLGLTDPEWDKTVAHLVNKFESCIIDFLRFPVAHEIAHMYLDYSEFKADKTAASALRVQNVADTGGYFSEVMIELVRTGAGQLLPNPKKAEELRKRATALEILERIN